MPGEEYNRFSVNKKQFQTTLYMYITGGDGIITAKMGKL